MGGSQAEQGIIHRNIALKPSIRSAHLEMYFVSGHSQITPENVARYEKDLEQIPLIKKANIYPPTKLDILRAPIEGGARASLIQRSLLGGGNLRWHEYIACVRSFPNEGREQFVSNIVHRGLASNNTHVQRIAAELIEFAPRKEEKKLKERVFNILKDEMRGRDTANLPDSLQMLRIIKNDVRATITIIEMGLNSKNPDVQDATLDTIHNIDFAPNEIIGPIVTKALEIIRQRLNDRKFNIQIEAMKRMSMFFWMPREKIELFIKGGLESTNIFVQEVAASNIDLIDFKGLHPLRNRISDNIQLGLQNPDVAIQQAAARMIIFSNREKAEQLILMGLKSRDLTVRSTSLRSVSYFFDPIKKAELIKIGQQDTNSLMQQICAELILKEAKDQASIIRTGMESNDVLVQRVYLNAISEVPEHERQRLVELAIQKGLGNILVQNPLYDHLPTENTNYFTPFEKTGSELLLVDGVLKDRIVMRKVTPRAFLAWRALYENFPAWRDAGFSYVPIEPIQSFQWNSEKKMVSVGSGVLDLNFEKWSEISSLFKTELTTQRDKILQVLNKLDITHGHAHDHNFCLRFFRDSLGNVDFTKVPRLYLIDFDEAFEAV